MKFKIPVLLVTFFLLSSFDVSSQSISGPTNVTGGMTYSYSYSGFVSLDSHWEAGNGLITSQNGRYVSVRWNSSGGTGILRLYDGGILRKPIGIQQQELGQNLIASKTVYIAQSAPPPKPLNPTTTTNSCGNQTLTMQPHHLLGITWYWQGKNSNGTSTSNSNNTYTATSSGRYYVRARNNSSGLWSSGSGYVDVTVNYPPAIPSIPTITYGCNQTTLYRGTPPNGITWYWQGTNRYGKSTSNSSSSYKIKYFSGLKLYYLRARNNLTGCWSSSKSIGVTVNHNPDTPSSPTVSNQCGQTVLTRGNPPSGITWYWQTGATGTSTSISSTTWTRTSSGTVYLRARDNSTGCWSGSRSISVNVKTIPSTPSASVSNNCGQSIITRGTPPSGVTWYWQGTNSSGTSTSNSNSTYATSTSGTYYIRARSSQGCWGGSKGVSVSVKTKPDIPSTPMVSNECGYSVLSIDVHPPSIYWYWQGTNSNGTSTANGNSTYTATSSGTYYIRARNSSGCWSDSRSVTVTVTSAPAQPATPTVSSTCGSSVLTRVNPPSGILWYWQGTNSNGTNKSFFGADYTVTSSGTYYLRSYNSATGCWGPSVGKTVSVKSIPSQPTASQAYNPSGGVTITRDVPPSGISWYWQGTNANGTSTANAALTYSVTTSGTYYLRAKSNAEGCWSSSKAIVVELNAAVPVGFSTIAAGPDKIALDWSGNGNETGFFIQRASDSASPFKGIYVAGATQTTFMDKNLKAGTRYYYKIQAIVGKEYSQQSVVKNAQTAGETGIESGLGYDPQYNGNIAAIKWNSGDQEKAYTYHYDGQSRLMAANYAEQSLPDSWNQNVGYNQVYGIDYDLNGNIKQLNRQQHEVNTEAIDQLQYHYRGNQLAYVEDGGSASGFVDNNNGTNDYAYDNNGNITRDLNKDITGITYNYMDLPEKITKADGTYLKYIYDATGNKLAQLVYDDGDNLIKRIDYDGELMYETDETGEKDLALIQHEEGRILKDETTGDYEYQYYLRDHLGNTRVTFTTQPKTLVFPATFETENSADEEATYIGIAETRVSFNGADAHRSDIDAAADNEVVQVNNAQPMGAGISLPVGVDDKLSMETYAYYEGGSGYDSDIGLAAFIGAVAGGYGGVSGGTEAQQATYDVFNNAISGIGFTGTSDDLVPAAYLNYILFDKNMQSYQHGHVQISDAANQGHEKISLTDIEISKPGFAFIYLTNESDSPNPVFFDDMKVTLKESQIVQQDDYYPFGLQHNTSWTRPFNGNNAFLYNAGSELNALTHNYETFYRNYDPALGRFNSMDPVASKYASMSPYNFGFNNPIYWNDPWGDDAADYFWDALSDLWNSDSGGSWSSDGGTSYYSSNMEGFYAGADYNDHFNSWDNTYGGSWKSAASAYKDKTGTLPLQGIYFKDLASNPNALNSRLNEAFSILDHSTDYWKTVSNPLVQHMYEKSGEFWSHPVTQGVVGGLTAVVGGGMIGGSLGAIGQATVGTRVASASVDAASQIGIGYATNGGDLVKAISGINVTSVALSALNPTASLRKVAFNASVASAFELRLNGNSHNLFTGKGLGDVAASTAISIATFGSLRAIGAFGNAGIHNSQNMGTSLLNSGFSPTSQAYMNNAYIWMGSRIMSTTGAYSGFGVTISTNLFGN